MVVEVMVVVMVVEVMVNAVVVEVTAVVKVAKVMAEVFVEVSVGMTVVGIIHGDGYFSHDSGDNCRSNASIEW